MPIHELMIQSSELDYEKNIWWKTKLEVHFKTTHGNTNYTRCYHDDLKVLLTLNIKHLIGETLWLGLIETKVLTSINIFAALPFQEFEESFKM